MTLGMYDISVPVFERILKNLGNILDKGVVDLKEREIAESVFLDARLYPDMLALTSQVQIVGDIAKGAVARLAGIEAPKYDDTEKSFAELQARLEKTLAFVHSADRAAIDASAERPITISARDRTLNFSGFSYLTGFVLPNMYFHSATAYGILRHNGVELGKRDFLGQI